MKPALRALQFDDLQMASEEVQSLLQGGYVCGGNWTLGQICCHLRLVQDPSIDGYPKWMSLFAFARPVMRNMLLPRLLRNDSPVGFPTSPVFVPPHDVDEAAEAAKFTDSVERFIRHQGTFAAHPAFGHLDRHQLEQVHATHAAHHLRFLSPMDQHDRLKS